MLYFETARYINEESYNTSRGVRVHRVQTLRHAR
jgi:hypothetical protein